MEYSKMHTLSLMLDQERKNLDNLKGSNEVNKGSDIVRAEANIRTLQEQLKQMCGDLLSRESHAKRGLFDGDEVERLLKANAAGHIDASYTLFSVMCIEMWCRQLLES